MVVIQMYQKYFKRFLDLIFAVTLQIVLFLPMLIIGIITRINTKETAIFSQVRSGINKKPFVLYKFRTMPLFARSDLPSLEAVGKIKMNKWQEFLRKSSLDELPQLVNIIKGDMSFVGPRPVICQETDLINERDKYGANSVRPGLTGWAQINGRDSLDYRKKARFDGEYVKNMSFFFDLKCVIKTILTVFTNRGI